MKKLLLALLIASSPAFATLNDISNGRRIATADGVALAYTFTFPAIAKGDLLVSIALGGAPVLINYTVTLNSDQIVSPGGTITFASPPPNLAVVTIQRQELLTQTTSLPVFNPFPAKTVERAFDSVMRKVQQVDRARIDLAAKEVQDITTVIAGGVGATDLLAPLATGSSNRRNLAARFADVTTATDFTGVDPTGIADSTNGLNNGIAATPSGGTYYVPPGTYTISGSGTEILLIAKVITFKCAGWGNTKFVVSSAGASTDIVRHTGVSEGFVMENCKFVPAAGTPGRFGLNLDATSTSNGSNAISKFLVAHNWFGQFGAAGVATTFPAFTDGVFNGTIRENVILGGVKLERAGDTIALRDNTLTGTGPGVYVNLVQGASQLLIDHNSITACNGSIVVVAGTRTKILHNNIEPTPGCAAGTNNTLIDLQGTVGDPIENAEIAFNLFSPTPGTTHNNIRLDRATATHIFANSHGYGDGTQKGIKTTANALDTFIEHPVQIAEATAITTLTDPTEDSGANTMMIRPFRGQFLFRGHILLDSSKILQGKDSAGTAIDLLTLNTADNFLQFGIKNPAAATASGIAFYANGLQHTQFRPGGQVWNVGNTFANLGAATAGFSIWCSNCNVATPCTGGGAGAWAFANGAQWKCPF